ncbi:MAG: hypothetical protein ACYC6A_18850 [Armatimonadota bacterium]
MNLHLTGWDIALLIAVSVMGTVLAYLYHPQWKAVMLTLPIPFSMAFLSLETPINVTNIAGLLVLLAFTHAVRILYYNYNVRIFITIAVSAVGYCLLGTLLARLLPKTDIAFWTVFVLTVLTGIAFYILQPIREDRGHRTTMPVWLKVPVMVAVVFMLILIKNSLQGFMTVFPMVGVIAAYEGRFSLWTNCHKVALIMFSMGPMMAVMYIVQHWFHWTAIPSLALGWAVLLSILLPMTREIWTLPVGETPAAMPERVETV